MKLSKNKKLRKKERVKKKIFINEYSKKVGENRKIFWENGKKRIRIAFRNQNKKHRENQDRKNSAKSKQ